MCDIKKEFEQAVLQRHLSLHWWERTSNGLAWMQASPADVTPGWEEQTHPELFKIRKM